MHGVFVTDHADMNFEDLENATILVMLWTYTI